MDEILHVFILRDMFLQSPIYRYYTCIYPSTRCGYQYLSCLVRINAHRKENPVDLLSLSVASLSLHLALLSLPEQLRSIKHLPLFLSVTHTQI